VRPSNRNTVPLSRVTAQLLSYILVLLF
jgi:hypothetical protein